MSSERELVARAARGDETAVITLYEQNKTAVFSYIYYRVGSDQALAEEITAEVVHAHGGAGYPILFTGNGRCWLGSTPSPVTASQIITGITTISPNSLFLNNTRIK